MTAASCALGRKLDQNVVLKGRRKGKEAVSVFRESLQISWEGGTSLRRQVKGFSEG